MAECPYYARVTLRACNPSCLCHWKMKIKLGSPSHFNTMPLLQRSFLWQRLVCVLTSRHYYEYGSQKFVQTFSTQLNNRPLEKLLPSIQNPHNHFTKMPDSFIWKLLSIMLRWLGHSTKEYKQCFVCMHVPETTSFSFFF